MHRPAGMSSESEDEFDFVSSIPLNQEGSKYKENVINNQWSVSEQEIPNDDKSGNIMKKEGFHSLSMTDLKEKEGKRCMSSASSVPNGDVFCKSPSKTPLDNVSNWSFNGDSSSYSEKDNYLKIENGSKGSKSPSPPSSYSNSSPRSGRKSKNWRKFRMHEGFDAPLEELRMASVQGNLPVVKALLKQGIAVDQILRGGWTALMFASSCGKHDLVRFLLQEAADPNMHKEMFTALMAACASSREAETDLLQCVNHLLEFGAKADTCERHRMTPLMFACKEGKLEVVERLIRAKVNVNKQDNKGWTALCWAATKGHGRVVRKLLEAEADPHRTNVHGQRAADIAMAAGHSQLADILERATLRDVTDQQQSDFQATGSSSVPKLIKMEATPQQHYGEMEMVLTGLNMADLIPVFHANKVTLECFLRLTEEDFVKMGIQAVGTRKKLLETIALIHKQEWKTTSLPNLAGLPYITLPDAVAMVFNINKHLRFIHASIGHLRDQIQATPRILQLGQEKHTVATLADSFSDSVKNLSHLQDEVKFFKAHLDKICNNAEFTTADTIIIRQDDGRQWQRRLLTSLVAATSVATVVYFCRPKIFSWIFSFSPYPQTSVFVDVL